MHVQGRDMCKDPYCDYCIAVKKILDKFYPMICPICEENFGKNTTAYALHYAKTHTEYGNRTERLRTRRIISRYNKALLDSTVEVECPLCTEKCDNGKVLRQHMSTHHGENDKE